MTGHYILNYLFFLNTKEHNQVYKNFKGYRAIRKKKELNRPLKLLQIIFLSEINVLYIKFSQDFKNAISSDAIRINDADNEIGAWKGVPEVVGSDDNSGEVRSSLTEFDCDDCS
ncbi:hypothetical protein BpHYR1_025783 [Brachionus plicatilis]|uniref:Uncharacterized protein n=1 Tax=Brachionus plicatilis TaxID=10195 RepID=A0A3M7R744_BRAPC|nr:hypothetical protein BpHYR1_025783 [Brachionus plicatilis]